MADLYKLDFYFISPTIQYFGELKLIHWNEMLWVNADEKVKV